MKIFPFLFAIATLCSAKKIENWKIILNAERKAISLGAAAASAASDAEREVFHLKLCHFCCIIWYQQESCKRFCGTADALIMII
jgi:hypothetical protein